MSKDLKDIIKDLRSHETNLKKAFIWYKEQEEENFGTNITYNGLDGIITQNEFSATTWHVGSSSGSVAINTCILMDSWGEENRLRMMYPIAEWVRMDRILRNLGITIQPVFQVWEFIAMSFALSYLNGYHLIYPWGNYILNRPATKQKFTRDALDKTEHELTISVMLKNQQRRTAKDRVILCIYPGSRVVPACAFNVSGNYYSSSIGKKFKKRWNIYCDQKRKLNWLCDGVVFKNDHEELYAAGGDNLEDIAVVYEKDKRIISPGIEDGCLPGTTMVTFFLIGETNGYTVENRAITLDDIKKADWGVVTEMATFVKWDAVIDPEKKEIYPVTKRNEQTFYEVFLKNFLRVKHGDTKAIDLDIPKMIERGEEWYPEVESRRKLAIRGLEMKKQRWTSEGWQNIKVMPPEGEVSFKRKRTVISNLYGRFWNLPAIKIHPLLA